MRSFRSHQQLFACGAQDADQTAGVSALQNGTDDFEVHGYGIFDAGSVDPIRTQKDPVKRHLVVRNISGPQRPAMGVARNGSASAWKKISLCMTGSYLEALRFRECLHR